MLPPLMDIVAIGGDQSAGAALLKGLPPSLSSRSGSSSSSSRSGSSESSGSAKTVADMFSPFVSPLHPALSNTDAFGVSNFADPAIAPVLPAIPVPYPYSQAAGFVRGVPVPPPFPVDPTLPAEWLKDFPIDHPLPPYMTNPLPSVPVLFGSARPVTGGALLSDSGLAIVSAHDCFTCWC